MRALMAILALSLGAIQAAVPILDAVNTPTAVTLKRGEYGISASAYDGGGLLNRNVISLHDNVNLGVAFDVENAIGEIPAKFNIPGVLGKVKFTDGFGDFPILLAVGYDAFYAGTRGKVMTDNPYNRMILGPYFTVTKPIYLFGEEQHIHGGIRMPIQPVYTPDDTEMYVGIDFPIGQFVPIFEIQRVFFDSSRLKETMFNIGLRFHFFEHLAFELDFMMGINGQRTNRMIVFEYLDRF